MNNCKRCKKGNTWWKLCENKVKFSTSAPDYCEGCYVKERNLAEGTLKSYENLKKDASSSNDDKKLEKVLEYGIKLKKWHEEGILDLENFADIDREVMQLQEKVEKLEQIKEDNKWYKKYKGEMIGVFFVGLIISATIYLIAKRKRKSKNN